jgi:hypothetical protein
VVSLARTIIYLYLNYIDPDVDLTVNSYLDLLHVIDRELADDDDFGLRAALTSYCLIADH